MRTRPRIALLTTGGTIAAVGHDRLDVTRYGETSRTVSADDLLSGVPEVVQLAEIEVDPVLDVPSHDITSRDWLRLAAAITAHVRGGAEGVVITHGTNTLEETAYFLHLTREVSVPVVLTGAMRPSSALSADGPANLLNAARIAVDPQARTAGVLVTFDDAVHAAAEVSKVASSGLAAFASPRCGPVGRIHPTGAVELWTDRAGEPIAPASTLSDLPRVEIITAHVDADGAAVTAALAVGARGIVVAGTGGGFLPEAMEVALADAVAAGVVVMVATRTGSGPATRAVADGWCRAGDLQPWKARTLLSVALAAGWSPDRIDAYAAG